MINVVIELSSKVAQPLSGQIMEALGLLGVQSVLKITSAHKAPPPLYEAMKEHNRWKGTDTCNRLVKKAIRSGLCGHDY
jgi:phosphoribosylcarboxyaminoimidazole (NCAIR) mutase